MAVHEYAGNALKKHHHTERVNKLAFTTVVGNVGDVQMKFTPNGKAVCEVSVAENHNRKNDQTGQWETESTTWRRVSFWENQAEAVADQVQKGDRVIVSGDEKLREYERKDGSKGASLEVRGRHIGKVVMPLQSQQQSGGFQNQQQGQPSGSSGQFNQQAPPPAGNQQASAFGQMSQGQDVWGGQPQGQAPPF